MPLIVVSTPCANALQRKRGNRFPLLALEPDEKMVKAKGKRGFQHPEEEHDTKTCTHTLTHGQARSRLHAYAHRYREFWVPSEKHFDSQWLHMPCTDMGLTNGYNPRRFLLVGPPPTETCFLCVHMAAARRLSFCAQGDLRLVRREHFYT